MKQKIFSILAIALLANGTARAAFSSRDEIRRLMEDATVGQAIDASAIVGDYRGHCYEETHEKLERLVVAPMQNAAGIEALMAISTLQLYDGYSLPQQHTWLTSTNPWARDFLKTVVATGLSGTNNNVGEIDTGPDFMYLYTAATNGNRLEVSVGRHYGCSPGIVCNPPLATSCRYGHNDEGVLEYNCPRKNDRSAFKQASPGVLISHRTADGWPALTPGNLMSFHLAPISTYCRWEKL